MKNGQLAGYQVAHKGQAYYAPKKDFYVGQSLLEDIHLCSSRAAQIKQALSHWKVQRDYYGPRWSGVEALHFELAKVVDMVHVEAAGWYRYPSSLRSDQDGKDWRLVVPDRQGAVAVNCHNLLHDNVWTLSTTAYSTQDIDLEKVFPLGHLDDHWTRVLLWTEAVAKVLETEGYDYTKARRELSWRLQANQVLRRLRDEVTPAIREAFRKVVGYVPRLPACSIGFATWRVNANCIGRYEHPTDQAPYGIITVHPKATRDWNYVREVVKHELIHHSLSVVNERRAHGEYFQRMAQELGLPHEYRD